MSNLLILLIFTTINIRKARIISQISNQLKEFNNVSQSCFILYTISSSDILQQKNTSMYSHKNRDQHHKRCFGGAPNPQKTHQREYTPSIDYKSKKSEKPRQFFYTSLQLDESFDCHNHDDHHHSCHRRHRCHRHHCCHHSRHGHNHHESHRHRTSKFQRSGNEIYKKMNSCDSLNSCDSSADSSVDQKWQRQPTLNKKKKESQQQIYESYNNYESHRHRTPKFQRNEDGIYRKMNSYDSSVDQKWQWQPALNKKKKESQQQIYEGHDNYESHRHRTLKFQRNEDEIYKKMNSSDSPMYQKWQWQPTPNKKKKESQQQIYETQRINRQFQYFGIIQSLKEQVNRIKIQSKSQSNKQNQDPPKQFICPILQQVMKNPTIITVCGHSYQKNSLKEWLESNPKCPVCRKACKVSDLQENYNLKDAIQRYYK